MTTSLEADELAVGMITREMCKGQDSWSSTPDQRRASALPGTAGRSIGLLWAGGGSKKKEGAPRPGAAAPQVFNGLLYYRMLQMTLRGERQALGGQPGRGHPLHLGVECP